jgi:hypothetical protein
VYYIPECPLERENPCVIMTTTFGLLLFQIDRAVRNDSVCLSLIPMKKNYTTQVRFLTLH